MMSYKKIVLLVFVLLVCSSFVLSAPVERVDEQITKVETFSKIDEEHRNTRKYFSDEMTRQVNEFYEAIDDRGLYYENEFNKMLMTTYLKLAMIIAGAILFSVAIGHVFRLKTERVRFNKLKKHLSEEIILELRKEYNIEKKNEDKFLGKDIFDLEKDKDKQLANKLVTGDLNEKTIQALKSGKKKNDEYKEIVKEKKDDNKKFSFLKKKSKKEKEGVQVFSEEIKI